MRERGVALVVALFFSIVVVSLAGSMIVSGWSMANQQRSVLAAQHAHSAAVSGVHYVIGAVDRSDAGLTTQGVTFAQNVRGAGDRTARFAVSVTPGSLDGLDNDLDGLVDEDDEWDVLEVASTGSYDGIRKTVRATLAPRYRVPLMPGAVYLDSPLATVEMQSNAITIDGTDRDLDATETGASLGTGIAVGGDPTQIESQIDKNLKRVTGDPVVGEIQPYDLDDLITRGAQAADVLLQDGSTSKPENPGDWGTKEAPKILYGTGDVGIASGSAGFGILIVDGNLRTTGGFTWTGLVIVRGGVFFGGGGSANRVVGSVIVKDSLSGDTAASMTNSGSSDLLYSRTALRIVRKQFASTYLVTNWREGPNPPEVTP